MSLFLPQFLATVVDTLRPGLLATATQPPLPAATTIGVDPLPAFDETLLTPVQARSPLWRAYPLLVLLVLLVPTLCVGMQGEPLRGWSFVARQVQKGAERPVCIMPPSRVTSI